MKNYIMLTVAAIFAVAVTAPAAHAATTIVAPNSCSVYAIVSVYADMDKQNKIGEQVAWQGSSANISVTQCPKYITVTSSKMYVTTVSAFFPTKCNGTITIAITSVSGPSGGCKSEITSITGQ